MRFQRHLCRYWTDPHSAWHSLIIRQRLRRDSFASRVWLRSSILTPMEEAVANVCFGDTLFPRPVGEFAAAKFKQEGLPMSPTTVGQTINQRLYRSSICFEKYQLSVLRNFSKRRCGIKSLQEAYPTARVPPPPPTHRLPHLRFQSTCPFPKLSTSTCPYVVARICHRGFPMGW